MNAAWLVYNQGTEFAGLWGGGSTLPGWRGRGIYRALVGRRAQLAAQLGVKYLLVDASAASRPILGRLGFVPIYDDDAVCVDAAAVNSRRIIAQPVL